MVLGIYGASGLGMELETVATLVQGQQNRWEDIVFIDDDETKDGTTLLVGVDCTLNTRHSLSLLLD